jgi:Flp pilus assembly pilin Flp
MRLLAKWWRGETGSVAVEYLLLAAIVGIALVVGCTNLATALSVGSGEPSQNGAAVTNNDGSEALR